MRYYKISIRGQSAGTVETQSTETLMEMLDYIKRGDPISLRHDLGDPSSIEDFVKQVQIELFARSLK